MKTLIVKTSISADGQLRLDIPSGLPPGPVEICLVIQPEAEPKSTDKPFYSTMEGCMVGCFPEETDVETILRQMDHDWQASILPKS